MPPATEGGLAPGLPPRALHGRDIVELGEQTEEDVDLR